LPQIEENPSKAIYKKGDTAYGFPPREGYKITSEPIEYEKHVIYDIQAIKDVPFKNVKLRLR
jgi:hypothetical protein